MAYEKQNFIDGEILKAGELNHIEDGIVNVELTPGPKGDRGEKGDTGAPGKDGAKGAAGANGKDGFGTEAQYNDIIARLDALETKE